MNNYFVNFYDDLGPLAGEIFEGELEEVIIWAKLFIAKAYSPRKITMKIETWPNPNNLVYEETYNG